MRQRPCGRNGGRQTAQKQTSDIFSIFLGHYKNKKGEQNEQDNRGAVIRMLPFWHFRLGTQGENLLYFPSKAC